MPQRSSLKKNEIEKALRTGQAPVRMVLQSVIDDAMTDKPSMRDFTDRLIASGITVIPNVASTGRVNGLAFELDGIVFGGSKLGKKYGWNQLQKQLDYQADRDNGLLQRLKQVARKNDETKSSAGSSDRQSRSPEKANQNSERNGQVNGHNDKQTRKISPEVSEGSPDIRTEGKQPESNPNLINSGPDSNRKHFINDELNNREVIDNDRTDERTSASGKKPGVTKIGAKPPAQVRNRLRNMSIGDLDGLSNRRKLLLPGDVPHQLEYPGTKHNQRLRCSLSERTTIITNEEENNMTKDKLKELIVHRVIQQRNEEADEAQQDEVMSIVEAAPESDDSENDESDGNKPILIIEGKPKASAAPIEKAEQLRRNEEFLLTLQLAFEQRGNAYYHKQTGKLAFVDEGEIIKGYEGLRNKDGSQNMTAHKAMAQASQLKFGDEFKSTGHEDYVRASWFAAALIGCNDVGYQPEPKDIDMLRDMIKEHKKKYKRPPKLHEKISAVLEKHEASLRDTQKHIKTASGGKSEAEIKAEQERLLNQKQTATVNIGKMVDRFRDQREQNNNHENKPDQPRV